VVSNSGFKDFQQIINVEDNLRLDLQLDPQDNEKTAKIEEVLIFGIKKDKIFLPPRWERKR